MADDENKEPEKPSEYKLTISPLLGVWSRFLLTSTELPMIICGARGVSDDLKPEFLIGAPQRFYHSYTPDGANFTKWKLGGFLSEYQFPDNPTNGDLTYGTTILSSGQRNQNKYHYLWACFPDYANPGRTRIYFSNDNGETWIENLPPEGVYTNITASNVCHLGNGDINFATENGGFGAYVFSDTYIPKLYPGWGSNATYTVNGNAVSTRYVACASFKSAYVACVRKAPYPGWGGTMQGGEIEITGDQCNYPPPAVTPSTYVWGGPRLGSGRSSLVRASVVGNPWNSPTEDWGNTAVLEIPPGGTSFEFRPPTYQTNPYVIAASAIPGTEGQEITLLACANFGHYMNTASLEAYQNDITKIYISGIVLQLEGLEIAPNPQVGFKSPVALHEQENPPGTPWMACTTGYELVEGGSGYANFLAGAPKITNVSHVWNGYYDRFGVLHPGQYTIVTISDVWMTPGQTIGLYRYFYSKIDSTSCSDLNWINRVEGYMGEGVTAKSHGIWLPGYVGGRSAAFTIWRKNGPTASPEWTDVEDDEYPLSDLSEATTAIDRLVGGGGSTSLFIDAGNEPATSHNGATAAYITYQDMKRQFSHGPNPDSDVHVKPASQVGMRTLLSTGVESLTNYVKALQPIEYTVHSFYEPGIAVVRRYDVAKNSAQFYLATKYFSTFTPLQTTTTNPDGTKITTSYLDGNMPSFEQRIGKYSWYDGGTSEYTIELEGPSTLYPNRPPIGELTAVQMQPNPEGDILINDVTYQHILPTNFPFASGYFHAGNRMVGGLFKAKAVASTKLYKIIEEEATAAPRRKFVRLSQGLDQTKPYTMSWAKGSGEQTTWLQINSDFLSLNDEFPEEWNWIIISPAAFGSAEGQMPATTKTVRVSYTPIADYSYRVLYFDFKTKAWIEADNIMPKDFMIDCTYTPSGEGEGGLPMEPIVLKEPRIYCLAFPLAKRGWRIDTDESWVIDPNVPVLELLITDQSFVVSQGEAVSLSVAATGGTPPYVWEVTGLPEGLSADQSGVITGTIPHGTYTTNQSLMPTFTVRDSLDPNPALCRTDSRALHLDVQIVYNQMIVSPTTLTFSWQAGSSGTIEPQVISVSNTWDKDGLAVSAYTTESWLEVNPTSGSTANGGVFSISAYPVDFSLMEPGSYADTVTISVDTTYNSPKIVVVQFTITPAEEE